MDQYSKPQSETLQATGVLEFRVSRPGVPIRRLRLTGNRYTFGRAPAATVRLDDPTLQPVHALLLREMVGASERLVLQSMSVPLQVNDRLTTEATLRTGDTFHLGEFQFEFIGSLDVPRTAAPASDNDSANRNDREQPPGEAKQASPEDEPTIRADGKAKPSSPRLSFAAGMRMVDDSEEATDSGFPLRPERTLDAIERALSSETERGESTERAAALRQEIEQTLRDESQRALHRQKTELSQEHRREMETVLQRFAETQEQAASANRAIESMRQQVADLGKQLRIATETKGEHHAELARAGKERDAARDELRQASAKSQRLISELDAARRDRSEISSSLHDITIQLYTAAAEGDKAQSRARELARQREEALQKIESFARRCEELTDQLRQAEQTCQTVSDQRDRFAEQLRQCTAERDSAIALADQRRDELIARESVIDTLRSQVTELEQAVAESRREAEILRTECQASCDSIAKLEEVVRQGEQQRQTDRESWEAESAELRASVEQISIELAAASSELTRSNEAADALNAELTETRDALADAESEIAVRPSADELQAIRERLHVAEQELCQLQAETSPFDGAPEPEAEDSPEDHSSVADEPVMQEGEIEQVREFLRSDDASAEYGTSGEASDERHSADREPEAYAASDAEADEDDDSIEAYMNRLLQRVQGGTPGSYSSPTPAPVHGPDEAKSISDETPSTSERQPIDSEAGSDDDDALFVPRSQAPERSKNLAAMRELANSSARTAIMSSVRKQAQSTALQKFGQAAGCAIASTVMLYYSQLRFGWQMLAAICMTVLAVYWVIEALQLQAQLRTEAQREATASEPLNPSEPMTDAASVADAVQEEVVMREEEDVPRA